MREPRITAKERYDKKVVAGKCPRGKCRRAPNKESTILCDKHAVQARAYSRASNKRRIKLSLSVDQAYEILAALKFYSSTNSIAIIEILENRGVV